MSRADTEVVKNRFLGFLLWQSVQSTAIYFLSKSLLLSLFTPNPFTPSLSGFLAFLAFHVSLLLISFSLFAVASPKPHRPSSAVELAGRLVNLVFVSGGQPLPPDFRRRAKISLSFVLFVAASALLGFLSLLCVCLNCFDDGGYYWRRLGRLGFRGLVVGFFYGLWYIYKRRWVLEFPIIQRPPFFSFKMGLSLATLQALKLSTAAYFFSAVMYAFLPYEFKGHVPMGKLIAEEIIFYMGLFVVFLCWELNHHLHQVLHTKRFMFAPPKGSAAAGTNPSEPLLAALEESTPRSIVQYLAYLDLCMVCENNVDTWRRAAFFEETGETYKRVIAVCLRSLEQFASKLGEGLESCSVDKSVQLGNQLRLPTDSQLDSRLHELFYDFQLCAWCARIVASLTAKSQKEDRFGVAQLSGSNPAVISTLLSCLLAVETLMGKKTNLQSSAPYLTGPASIKWATLSTGKREASMGGGLAAAGKRRGSPLYSKAYAMADILRTSIYCIVSAFHDEMLSSAKAGLLDKEWISGGKPLYGTRELLSQKLRLFLDFQAN
ncbi:Nucleoporin like [Actinidia chinensis var. chinensis]|uniref:Nucleoporin like n=1 Tax=Actinidia chinensis var. chinensis TaxID=1590841 RepID=A0A2R6PCG7_ACTCC|nr:Nucleoporin like [Actinidia chinensis var. chinensis]